MPLDPEAEAAIEEVLIEASQPEAVIRRLSKWLNELADGNTTLEDHEDVQRRIDGLFESVVLDLNSAWRTSTMAFTLWLNGWSSQGLRCPDHSIELSLNQLPRQVSLIQMPNGTGKTTSLTMLRAALSGLQTLGMLRRS